MNSANSIDISSLNTVEKLGLMERLWADLARRPEEIEIPKWHLEQLEDAEAAISNGTDEFVDVDVFEAELREKAEQRRSR
jgi:hypothetical protein